MKNNLPYLVFAFLLILNACDPGMIYDQFEQTENQEWKWDDVKKFEVEMTDTITHCNIYLNIRHTKDYPKSNLYVFLRVKGPFNSEIRDTIEVAIASPDGRWLGSGFGDIKFVRKKIRSDIRFAHKGLYVFEVEQGMRSESLPVTDIGIRIEKYKSLN